MLELAAGVQPTCVRRANRLRVYTFLLAGLESTRAEIARDTGLSIPTVTTILGEFADLELVRVVGEAEPRGGRPAQVVALGARARYVLSLDLSGDCAQAALVDLRGQHYPLATGPRLGRGGEAELEGWLTSLLGSLAEKNHLARIVVAVPGVVDQKSGQVRLAPVLGWTDYALGEMLSRLGGVRVILENDVNALALAEKAHLPADAFEHALFVRIDRGIGASLFVGGELYRGAGAAAGEIGYSLLPHTNGLPASGSPTGRELKLGAPGPLETYLFGLSGRFLGLNGHVTLQTEAAQRAFTEFADAFGLIIHNLVCLLDPERVIVSWPADPEGHFVARLRRTYAAPRQTNFCSSQLGADAALCGAAQIALTDFAQSLCSSPGSERLI